MLWDVWAWHNKADQGDGIYKAKIGEWLKKGGGGEVVGGGVTAGGCGPASQREEVMTVEGVIPHTRVIEMWSAYDVVLEGW